MDKTESSPPHEYPKSKARRTKVTNINDLHDEIDKLEGEVDRDVEIIKRQSRELYQFKYGDKSVENLQTRLASADKVIEPTRELIAYVKEVFEFRDLATITRFTIPISSDKLKPISEALTKYGNSKGSAARKDNKDNNSGCLCQRCGWRYKVDFNIPDVLWKKIKLKGSPDEGGLLCGRCIADKIEELNLYKCLYIQELSPATHFESQRDLEPDEQAAFEKHISRGDKKIGKVQTSDEIRSEVTHEQEIAVTHPPPSQEIIDSISDNLKQLEKILGVSKHSDVCTTCVERNSTDKCECGDFRYQHFVDVFGSSHGHLFKKLCKDCKGKG